MKKMKRWLSMALALILALAMAVPAMAAGKEGNVLTITFKRPGHTYDAYQIFTGDYDATADRNQDGTAEKTLSNLQWGDGVVVKDLLEALKSDAILGNDFAFIDISKPDEVRAADVADVLKSYSSTTQTAVSEKANAFAKVVSGCLTETVKGSSVQSQKPGTENDPVYEYKISGLPDGYYFVKDRESKDVTDDAYTKFILQLLGDESVEAKAVLPTHEKVIEGGSGMVSNTTEVSTDLDKDPDTTGDVHYNNEAIGDDVPFKITTSVPDMREYDWYQFVLEDTMDKGLTFNPDSVEIKVGNITLEKKDLGTDGNIVKSDTDKGNYYAVRVTALGDNGTKVEIIFDDFILYKDNAGAPIVIRYRAALNEYANIGSTGNKNTSTLKYSVNPNHKGGTDDFGPSDPKGTTPESWTLTFVTGLQLTKVAAGTNGAATLKGAQFTITGARLNQTIITGYEFVQDDSGSYWRLKDGSYTTDDPSTPGINQDKYEPDGKKYKKVAINTTKDVSTEVNVTAEVGEDGVLAFKGLAAGKYTITEIKAPAGYNLLSEPIYIRIDMTAPSDPANPVCTWKAYRTDSTFETYLDLTTLQPTTDSAKAAFAMDQTTQIFGAVVENSSGVELPSTGGIGTTIFYIIGGILVAGAGVLLVSRKRMSENR